MLNRLISILAMLVLLILAVYAGYYFGTKKTASQTQNISASGFKVNPVLQDLTAWVEGKIIGYTDQDLTLMTTGGQNHSFKFARDFLIYEAASTSAVIANQDKNRLKPNTKVNLLISFTDNDTSNYQIKGIYLIKPESPPNPQTQPIRNE